MLRLKEAIGALGTPKLFLSYHHKYYSLYCSDYWREEVSSRIRECSLDSYKGFSGFANFDVSLGFVRLR